MPSKHENKLVGLKITQGDSTYEIIAIEETIEGASIIVSSDGEQSELIFDAEQTVKDSLYQLLVNAGYRVINDISV
jgi:hypothetical protein